MPLLRTGVADGTADLVEDEVRRDELLDELIRGDEDELLDEVVDEDDVREVFVVVVTINEDVDNLELELEVAG